MLKHASLCLILAPTILCTSCAVPNQAGEPLQSGVTVLLLVPESWDGQAVQVQVKGLAAGELRAEGAGSCKVQPPTPSRFCRSTNPPNKKTPRRQALGRVALIADNWA